MANAPTTGLPGLPRLPNIGSFRPGMSSSFSGNLRTDTLRGRPIPSLLNAVPSSQTIKNLKIPQAFTPLAPRTDITRTMDEDILSRIQKNPSLREPPQIGQTPAQRPARTTQSPQPEQQQGTSTVRVQTPDGTTIEVGGGQAATPLGKATRGASTDNNILDSMDSYGGFTPAQWSMLSQAQKDAIKNTYPDLNIRDEAEMIAFLEGLSSSDNTDLREAGQSLLGPYRSNLPPSADIVVTDQPFGGFTQAQWDLLSPEQKTAIQKYRPGLHIANPGQLDALLSELSRSSDPTLSSIAVTLRKTHGGIPETLWQSLSDEQKNAIWNRYPSLNIRTTDDLIRFSEELVNSADPILKNTGLILQGYYLTPPGEFDRTKWNSLSYQDRLLLRQAVPDLFSTTITEDQKNQLLSRLIFHADPNIRRMVWSLLGNGVYALPDESWNAIEGSLNADYRNQAKKDFFDWKRDNPTGTTDQWLVSLEGRNNVLYQRLAANTSVSNEEVDTLTEYVINTMGSEIDTEESHAIAEDYRLWKFSHPNGTPEQWLGSLRDRNPNLLQSLAPPGWTGIPRYGWITPEDLGDLPGVGNEEIIRRIEQVYNGKRAQAIRNISEQIQAEERLMRETGAPGLTSQTLNRRISDARMANRAKMSDAEIELATQSASEIAKHIIESAKFAKERYDSMLKTLLEAGDYDEVQTMIASILPSLLSEAGYTKPEIARMINEVAQGAWESTMVAVAQSYEENGEDREPLIRALMRVTYPNGKSPTRQEVLEWLYAHDLL